MDTTFMAVWGAPIGIALAMWIVFWIVSFFIVWFLLSIYCYKNESYKYKNKHVIITGGSSGIGLEMAKIYLSLGANVTIVARDKKKLEVAVKELSILIHTDSKSNTNTDRIESISLNVSSDLDTVTKALASSISKFGPCDVLVNCAGTSIAHPFSSTENDSFRRMYEVNLLGSVYTTQAVLDGMRKQRSGRIIFVSSQLGQLGLHGYTAYCASKFALRGFAEALQMELKVYNVYVSVAHPPDTQTPGYDVEMMSKPPLTKLLSESGHVFDAASVAKNIVSGSTNCEFAISTGLDGWMVKQLVPGLAPINNALEVTTQIFTASLFRFVALFFVHDFYSKVDKWTKVSVGSLSKQGEVVNSSHNSTNNNSNAS